MVPDTQQATEAATLDRVKDPVCGMLVDPTTSKHRAEHAGNPFHFCSAGCRTKLGIDTARSQARRNGCARGTAGGDGR